MIYGLPVLILNRLRPALLIACVAVTGYPHASDARECAPETALLWLRLGIAVGQNHDAPTSEELMTLLASIEDPQSLEMTQIPEQAAGTSIPKIQASPVHSPDPALMDTTDRNSMLASIETDTFWIRLCNPDARVVYMIIDPTCPFCSQGLQKLAPLISIGEIQARIILAPFLREESTLLAAELILAANPAEAIWQHEIVNRGQVHFDALTTNRQIVAELGAKGLGWLQANLEWMRSRQLNSVPLYIWAEPEEGEELRKGQKWHIRAGVQEPEIFQAALPSPDHNEESFGLPREIEQKTGQTFLNTTPLPLDP